MLAAAALLAVYLTASHPPRTLYADRVGLSSHSIWLPAARQYRFLQRAEAGGVQWIREDFAWSVLEPRRGHFRWRRTDALMRTASRLRLNVVAMVGYSPGWASGHEEADKYPPRDVTDYARFAVAVARRYGENGTFWRRNPKLHEAPLRAIEIWNEPWVEDFWRPTPDVAAYAAMVRAAAPAVKRASPGIKVLVAVDLRYQAKGRPVQWYEGWLRDLLRQDYAFGSVDGYTVHPYSEGRGPYQTTIDGYADQAYAQQWLFQQVLVVRDMLRRAGKMKPFWLTEFGWSTGVRRGESSPETTEAVQASYVRGALERSVDEWRSFVARSFVYAWDRPKNDSELLEGYALVRSDGSAKPAWKAIKQLIASGR